MDSIRDYHSQLARCFKIFLYLNYEFPGDLSENYKTLEPKDLFAKFNELINKSSEIKDIYPLVNI